MDAQPNVPAPSAARLLRPAWSAIPPPPFGLEAWTAGDATDGDTPAALVVLVESEPARDVPEASSLRPDTLVLLPREGANRAGLLAKLRAGVRLTRDARARALLARGYVDLGAGADARGSDWVWGRVPSREAR